MSELEKKAWGIAYSAFTTSGMPDSLDDMGDDELMDYLRETAWEPFEYWEPRDVWDLIESLYLTVMKEFEGGVGE